MIIFEKKGVSLVTPIHCNTLQTERQLEINPTLTCLASVVAIVGETLPKYRYDVKVMIKLSQNFVINEPISKNIFLFNILR